MDGLVTSDEEERKPILDREACERSGIEMTVYANKKVDSSKRKDSRAIV
jgi:hypothetical protein